MRLSGYDYSSEGVYFITISSKNKTIPFCTIKLDKVELTSIGKVVEAEWLKTPQIRTGLTLGTYVIMPDHFHALILLHENPVEAHSYAPLTGSFKNKFGPQKRNLSSIIRGFKGACTKKIKIINPEFSWQRSFHDRVLRDQQELERVEEYIVNNPLKWSLEKQSDFIDNEIIASLQPVNLIENP